MDVVLGVRRQLEVDDVGQILDVEPASRHVRCHQHPDLAILEALEGARPLRLGAVAVDRDGLDALAIEPRREPGSRDLGPGEDQHLAHVVAADQVGEQGLLPLPVHRVDDLPDRLDRRIPGRHFDRRRVVHEHARQLAHLVVERGREQEVLALLGQQGEDLADVGDESHVEHAVRFVEHEDLDLAQVGRLLAHVIEEPPRCRDEQLDTGPELLELGFDGHAAVHAGDTERDVLAVALGHLLDLHAQLARGREHEGTDGVTGRREARVRVELEPLEDGQDERGGLAGSGLGGREDIPSFEDERDRLGLDGSRGCVALLRDGSQEVG